MKAYGIPRNQDVADPDLGDMAFYGLAAGRLHPKWTANGDSKRRVRRYWKKRERRKVRRKTANTVRKNMDMGLEIVNGGVYEKIYFSSIMCYTIVRRVC